MKTIIVLSLVAACLLGCSMLKEMSSDGQLPAVVKELPSALPFPWNLVASGVLGVFGADQARRRARDKKALTQVVSGVERAKSQLTEEEWDTLKHHLLINMEEKSRRRVAALKNI